MRLMAAPTKSVRSGRDAPQSCSQITVFFFSGNLAQLSLPAWKKQGHVVFFFSIDLPQLSLPTEKKQDHGFFLVTYSGS